jgi:hypothetical protein
MKKFLGMIIGIALMCGIAYGAGPTRQDYSTLFYGVQKFVTIYSGTRVDSILGATKTKTLVSKKAFPTGWEYILTRDTLGTPLATTNRDSCRIMFYLDAYNDNNKVIGTVLIDSIGKGEGSSPDQYYIPVHDVLVGSTFSIRAVSQTAKDSVYMHNWGIWQRGRYQSNRD